MTTKPADLPLFRDHTLSWLAERVPYTELSLMKYKQGYRPMSPRFRRVCAQCLHKSEAELFGPDKEEAAQ
jgi:hypothetical protein